MSGPDLHGWSSRLPEWASGELDDGERALLEEAMAADPELRAEAELVLGIMDARPDVPSDLAARVTARLDADGASRRGRSRWATGWRLSSAAILVLAMGTAVIWQNRGGPLPNFPNGSTPVGPVPDAWLLDDGVVAGGAVLDELSDEELALLLDDLEW